MGKYNKEINRVRGKTVMGEKEGVRRCLPGKANRDSGFRSQVKCLLPSKALPDLPGEVVP